MTEPYYQDEHVTLYHGDAREVLPVVEDESASAVITDPPYGVDKHGLMLGQISANYHEKGTHSRGYADHDSVQFEALLKPTLREAVRALKPGRHAGIFGATRTLHETAHHATAVGLGVMDLVSFAGGGTFAKSRTTLMPAHEPMLLCRKAGKPYELNPKRNVQNVLESRKGRQESDHPTTKPLAWMEWLVRLLTHPGELVLDPFAGSGSTLIAARNLGRKAVGVELEEHYCEITAQRLSQVVLPLEVEA